MFDDFCDRDWEELECEPFELFGCEDCGDCDIGWDGWDVGVIDGDCGSSLREGPKFVDEELLDVLDRLWSG